MKICIIAVNTKEQSKKNNIMKKQIFISAFCLLFGANLLAQTTATNFVTNDCNGVTHHLFDSLDAGNVIVIAWVMPCAPCATDAMPAYSAAQSFSSSHPERVHFYMADDYANTSCSSLSSWGNNNNMPNSTFFSTSDINMNDYGTHGMPKVVVLGGTNHTIYFNQNESHINWIGVQTAISNALGTLSVIKEQPKRNFALTSFPNPTKGLLNISYTIHQEENISFSVVDILGESVLTINDNSLKTIGENKKIIDISKLNSGVYFLTVSSSYSREILKFVVSH